MSIFLMVSAGQKTVKEKWLLSVESGRVSSAEIFQFGNELTILHNGFEYKLRLTGNGKLILTK